MALYAGKSENPALDGGIKTPSDNVSGADNQQERLVEMPESSETTRATLKCKPKKADIIYMAAMLDAEGWISGTTKSGRHGKTAVVTVGICNTYKPLIQWMVNVFGGTLYTEYIESSRGVLYEWHCPSDEIVPFLKLVIPFLKIKQQQAYLAMAFRSFVRKDGTRAKKHRLVCKIIALNQR